MKGLLDRTKVVLRHLPPTITQSMFMEQVDSRFSGRYHWLCFRPGKSSQHQLYSKAYINFNRSEDVIEFAEFFDGHVFVNEKGTQFKVIVEYAPSQRVPKQWSKKDGREGTILKDPQYLEFLDILAKPVENLPSAEIQLERKEANRAGAPKDAPIVTPLMDYIRQKRAAKSGPRRPISNGKSTRRVSGVSTGSPGSGSTKRGSEKRTSSMGTNGRQKSTYPKREIIIAGASGADLLGDEKGVYGSTDMGKKRSSLKGNEKEIPNVSDVVSVQQRVASVKNLPSSSVPKQNQRRVIKGLLVNKDNLQNQSSSAVPSEQQLQVDKDKRLPRPPSNRTFSPYTNGPSEDKVIGDDARIVHIGKQEKRTRNRDRPDRGVWTPLRRSDGSHASDESLSSSSSQPNQVLVSVEGVSGGMKGALPRGRGGSARISHSSIDDGSYKHGGRRGSTHIVKDAEGGSSIAEGKPVKKGGSSGFGAHEKRVWVQKSTSGS